MDASKPVTSNLPLRSSFASKSIRLTLSIGLFVTTWCARSSALDPNLQLTQVGDTAWRVREGIFLGAALSHHTDKRWARRQAHRLRQSRRNSMTHFCRG